ncbi:MAG: RidA family protein, partial [Caulobacterales bacterium]|nr:RidA family protein [Caulobacterales bacterium]
TAGIVSADENFNTICPDDIRGQTRQVLSTIQAIIEGAGGSMEDVACNHIFLKDLSDWPAMNEVYAEFFTSSTPPARYVVQAGLLKPEWLIEIASVAYVDA